MTLYVGTALENAPKLVHTLLHTALRCTSRGNWVTRLVNRQLSQSKKLASKKQRLGTTDPFVNLLPKKRGRSLLLGEFVDTKLQLFLQTISRNDAPVAASIAIAAARGLLLAKDKKLLSENGGHIKLDKQWAYLLFRRMGFALRKPTTAKSRMSTARLQRSEESLA